MSITHSCQNQGKVPLTSFSVPAGVATMYQRQRNTVISKGKDLSWQSQKSLRPRHSSAKGALKHQRLTSHALEPHPFSQAGSQEQWCTPLPDNIPPAPLPVVPVAAPPSEGPTDPKSACTVALSAHWSGPGHFDNCKNRIFEDSSNISDSEIQPDAITKDAYTSSEDADTDSDTGSDMPSDGNSVESDGIGSEWVPEITETDAEMNAAEHGK